MKRWIMLMMLVLLSVIAANAEESFLHDCIVYWQYDCIYAINLDGSGGRILANRHSFTYPAIAPDGKNIVFESLVGTGHIISVLNLEDLKTIELVCGEFPSFSPQGDKILYVKGGPIVEESKICLMKLDETEEMVFADGIFPHFSSDGKSIFYCRNWKNHMADVCIMNIDGKNNRKIVEGLLPVNGLYNKILIYNSSSNTNDFRLIDVNGNQILSLKDVYSPSLSSDAKKVVYYKWIEDHSYIHILDIDDMSDRAIAEGTLPIFSPDGKRVIYSYCNKNSGSIHKSCNEIHIISIDGTNEIKLADDGFHPTFAPMLIDGRLLDTYGNWHDVR